MKITQQNTQSNLSNAQQQQQQTAFSLVEIAPLNVGSYPSDKLNDARIDADDGLITAVASLNSTSDDVENQSGHDNKFYSEIQNINGTNDIMTIQAKLPINKHKNEETTEKLQTKAKKLVDNYPVVSEPHEANNAIGDNIFSDVDTNFIDVGQQIPRNTSSSKFPFWMVQFQKIVLIPYKIVFQEKSINDK